jgi:uncharacterized protein (TIGR02145 family)
MKKLFLYFIFFTFFGIISQAQKFDSFKDNRDGKLYNTVKIGEHVWMSENLEVDKFQNGDLIRKVNSSQEWILACNRKEPVWMYSPNNLSNGKKLGKIYNYYAVIDTRNLAPLNFRIPYASDFLALSNLSVNMLKSQTGWFVSTFTKRVLENVDRIDRNGFPYTDLDLVEREFTIGRSGSNELGFNAFPSGSINVNGIFELFGKEFCLWSYTKGNNANKPQVFKIIWDKDNIEIRNADITQGFYIRCVSGRTQEEIDSERIIKNKREKFIKDSLFYDKQNKERIQLELLKKYNDSLSKVKDDSIRNTLTIGSIYRDGIVLSINENKHGVLISNLEFIVSLRQSLEKVKEFDKNWRIPTNIEMENFLKMVKKNNQFKTFYYNTYSRMVGDNFISGNIFWWWAISENVNKPTYYDFWYIMKEKSFMYGKSSLLYKRYGNEEQTNQWRSRLRFAIDF